MKTKTKAKKQEELVIVEAPQPFRFLPMAEGTNNLSYWRELAVRFFKVSPVSVFLTPRDDGHGPIKDAWGKEVIRSFDVSFLPVSGAIEGIAINITGMEHPRWTFDPHYDYISHVKTLSVTKEKNVTKWLVFKPLDGQFLDMKLRGQVRFGPTYEKKFVTA
jgi:hypothetical protein